MVFGPPGIFFSKTASWAKSHPSPPEPPIFGKKKERLGSETSARIVWCLRHLYVGFLECEKWKEP